tara:strand:+ start:2494 stop:2670 length:177 start_codon:yes stop_codon:yes gene_type:complete
MRKKFWDYMHAPTPKKLAKLTTEEQAFAETLSKQDKWPDGQMKELPKAKPSDLKPKGK